MELSDSQVMPIVWEIITPFFQAIFMMAGIYFTGWLAYIAIRAYRQFMG